MSHPRISIIIPAYNEESRIGCALEHVLSCIEEHGWNAEVLVVDDGSDDATTSMVETWMANYPRLHLIRNRGNRGKGHSVRNGALQAIGDIVIFTDADLSSPMIEAESLIAAIEAGADVAIGSRWLDRTRQKVPQPLYRKIFGRCFNTVTRIMIGLPFKDTQCGFKAFKRDAAQVIFRLQTIERWGFDPELLFIAGKLGYKVLEVPVTWGHDDRSRISYIKDGLKMLEEMATIRLNAIAGRYDRAIAEMKDTSESTTANLSYDQASVASCSPAAADFFSR